MRWLLLKDLQILRRSPLLLALLVALPGRSSRCSSGVGAVRRARPSRGSRSSTSSRPARTRSRSAAERLDASDYAARLFEAVEPVRVRHAGEAIAKVRSGEALGALVIPADAIERLQQHAQPRRRRRRPRSRCYYNAENPLKRRYVAVDDPRHARRRQPRAVGGGADARRRATSTSSWRAATLDVPIGGRWTSSGCAGRRRSSQAVTAALPEGTPERVALDQVARFARLAADNLDLSQPILGSIGTPVRVSSAPCPGPAPRSTCSASRSR